VPVEEIRTKPFLQAEAPNFFFTCRELKEPHFLERKNIEPVKPVQFITNLFHFSRIPYLNRPKPTGL
jgi:hypothetical protein